MLNKTVIAGIIIVILLIFVANAAIIWCINNTVKTLFDGFYSADPVFCEESGLEMMVLYFDHGDGYLMIKTVQDVILLNTTFQYKLVSQSGMSRSIEDRQIYQIIFKNIEEQEFFPTTQMLEFMPATQRIKLYSREDQSIYGILYKNNAITDIKQLLDTPDLPSENPSSTEPDHVAIEENSAKVNDPAISD